MALLERARRFFDALNAQDLETVEAMIAPDADIRTPIGAFTGGAAYRDWMAMHFRALPDFVHEVRGFAAEQGQTVAFELHASGTFSGPLALPGGDAAPTGRRIDISAVDVWRFDDGLITDYRLYFDRIEFLDQLGLPRDAL